MEENIIYKIEIIQLIESKYNIEIKDEEVESILTLENLIELIKIKQIIKIKNKYTSGFNKLD